MKLRYKVVLGVTAVAVASAASFPNEFGLSPTSWRQREALTMCQRANSTFVRFLASDRDSCYSRMRTAIEIRTGIWSRHNHGPQQLAQVRAEKAVR
ncbi:MAG: hypothetical protein ACM3JG_20205 [Thiohalocapsa sp.]